MVEAGSLDLPSYRRPVDAPERALRWAEKIGHIDKSPVKGMEKPEIGKRSGGARLRSFRLPGFHGLFGLAARSGGQPIHLGGNRHDPFALQ
jgi:hypothetical protein